MRFQSTFIFAVRTNQKIVSYEDQLHSWWRYKNELHDLWMCSLYNLRPTFIGPDKWELFSEISFMKYFLKLCYPNERNGSCLPISESQSRISNNVRNLINVFLCLRILFAKCMQSIFTFSCISFMVDYSSNIWKRYQDGKIEKTSKNRIGSPLSN